MGLILPITEKAAAPGWILEVLLRQDVINFISIGNNPNSPRGRVPHFGNRCSRMLACLCVRILAR